MQGMQAAAVTNDTQALHTFTPFQAFVCRLCSCLLAYQLELMRSCGTEACYNFTLLTQFRTAGLHIRQRNHAQLDIHAMINAFRAAPHQTLACLSAAMYQRRHMSLPCKQGVRKEMSETQNSFRRETTALKLKEAE